MTIKHSGAPLMHAHLPELTPALQVVDYWMALASIASYAWFNSTLIAASRLVEGE